MAYTRAEALNMVRDPLGIPRVDYTNVGWSTSAAATDPMHSEDILAEDLYRAMKMVVGDGRGKIARKGIRIIEDQYEYPLPAECMTVKSLHYKDVNTWRLLDYLHHGDFFTNFSEAGASSVPTVFTFEEGTSAPVHATGSITTADASTPPILKDSAANFGVTRSGLEIMPNDIVYNTTDDSYGYVYYLYASTWKKEANADTGSSATQLYDADAGFTTLPTPVAVGDIIYRLPMPVDAPAYGRATKVTADTITFTRLYNHEAGFAANDTYKVGIGNWVYLTSDSLVKDTEEGLVGGAEMDFDYTLVATITGTTFTSKTVTGSGVSSITAGMVVDSITATGQPTGGIVSSVSGSTITLTSSWSNGTPANGTSVAVGTGDTYQIESQFHTLNTLYIGDVPSASNPVGTENLRLFYYPYPAKPTKYYHYVELPEAAIDALVAKIYEYCKMRERGEIQPYEYLLDRYLARTRTYNMGNRGIRGRRQHVANGTLVRFTLPPETVDYR